MSNAENSKRELEMIDTIISNAHNFSKGKTPSVTDVLRSYDDFITKNKISSTSQSAQNVYKVLLRAARKKGEDWLKKIKTDSQYQSKDSNIFRNNHAEEVSYSFAKENNSLLSNDPSNRSLVEDNSSDETASLNDHEKQPFFYTQESSYTPLTLETLKQPTPKSSQKEESLEFPTDELSQVYRNPYLRNQKPQKPSDFIKPPDFTSFKYRDQSPPVRDYDIKNLLSASREESSLHERSKMASPDVGSYITDSATNKYREIEKLVRDVESQRQKNLDYINNKKTLPPRSSVKETEGGKQSQSVSKKEESIDDLLFQDLPRREKDVMNDYFEALKINTLRAKRNEGRAQDTLLSVNREMLMNCFREWRNYSNHAKLKNRGKKIARAVYTQTLLVRYYSEWLKFHYKIKQFTSNSRSFVRHQSLNSVQYFFDAWKNAVWSNKAAKLNKYTAQFFFEKRLNKKVFSAWRNHILTKKSYERMSWEAYLGYRYKLVQKCFRSWNKYQQTREERNRIKFDLEDRTDQFAKKLAFKRFTVQLVEFKEYIELEKKIFNFFRNRSIRQFFSVLPNYAACSKVQKRKLTKATVFQDTVLMKNFFTYLYSVLQGRKEQEKYTEIFYYTKLGKKSFFSLKFWTGFNKVPAFQNVGLCVWILYNLLSYCINKKRTSTTGSARGSHSIRYSVEGYSAKGKTPDASFTERFLNPPDEFVFALPAYFPLAQNKKYEAKHYEANKTLNLYIEQSLFQSWKKSTQTLKAFKNRNINRFISTYFFSWKKYSVSKIIGKYNVRKHSSKWNKPICFKLFKAWKTIAREKKVLKQNLKYVLTRKNTIALGQQFRLWHRMFKAATKDRDFNRIAEEQAMMRYLKKSWRSWCLFTEKSKKHNVIMHQFLKKKLELLQFYSLKGWKIFLEMNEEKKIKEKIKDEFFEKHASKKFFKAWKKQTNYKKNIEEMITLLRLKKRRIFIAKLFRRWKKVQLESITEQRLNEKLQQHYNNKLQRKGFFALVVYSNHHGIQRQADEAQMKKIASISTRNFFKRWFRASVHNGALRIFSRLFTILQVRQFFKNLYLKVYKHDMIMTTLAENKSYHIQRIFFNSFKRFAQRKMKLRYFQNTFYENKLIRLERDAYIIWRRNYLFEKNVSHLYARSMIDVKNQVLLKYFNVLKKKWFLNSMEKYKIKERKLKLRQKIFRSLKAFVKKSAIIATIYQKEMKRRNQILKKKYLHAIAKRYAKRVHDRKLGEQLVYTRMYKFLSLWVEAYNTKSERSQIQLKPLDFGYETMSLRGTIYNYRSGMKPTKELFFNIKRVYDEFLNKKFFDAWRKFAEKSKSNKRKIWKLQTKHGNFMKDLFVVWRNKYIKRRNIRRKLEFFQQSITKFVLQAFFNNLLENANDKIQGEILDQRSALYYYTRLKQVAFTKWFTKVRNTLITRQNMLIAEDYYLQKLVKFGYIALFANCSNKKKKVANNIKAEVHYINRLKKVPFLGWKNYFMKKALLNVLQVKFDKIKTIKAAPEVFQRFRMNYYLNLFHRVAVPKAQQYYTRMLKIKTFLSFKIVSAKKNETREKMNRAALHYFSHLLLKTMRCWLAYLVMKKNKQDLRQNLIDKIQKVDAENLISVCFNVLKIYKEESQEYLVDLRTIMIENGMRRILQFWKNHCDRKNLSKRVITQFEKLRVQNAKSDFFKKWRKAYRIRVLLYTTLRVSFMRAFRINFLEWKRNAQQFGRFEEFSSQVNDRRKAKFWNLWLKVLYERKIENKKSLAVFSRQAQNLIEESFFNWRRAFKSVVFDKIRLNKTVHRGFYKWRAYTLERKKKMVYVEAAQRTLMMKAFRTLAENAAELLKVKSTLAKVLNKKIKKELSFMEVAFQTWLIYVDDCRNDERKQMGAIEYHTKLLLYKSFVSWKKFNTLSSKGRRFLEIISNFEQEKVPGLTVARIFHQLKKTSKLERAYLVGCYKVEKAMKSTSRFLLKLKANAEYQKRCILLVDLLDFTRAAQNKREALGIIKQSAERVSISIARSNEYIAWKYQYVLKESFLAMRDYTARRLHEKINEEKARTFYLERTLPIFYYNSFKIWKDQTLNSLISIEEKVNAIQEKLVYNRVKDCILRLHKHAQTQKELRFKTDPSNPKFTEYLESTVNKHYKKYFKKMFNFAETKKKRRELRHSLVEKYEEIRSHKLVAFYFKVLKSHYYQEKTSTLRYQLYAIFSAWKMHSREKSLLKKYLRESNMPETLAYTPITDNKGTINTKSSNTQSGLSNTRLSGLSAEFAQTNYTRGQNSAVKIERDLMISSFKDF